MKRHLFGRGGDNSAAVAPTVALSLFALIGAGGIAFDYARMASLDTELQNAADQAALAGATQLDGQDGAVDRAKAAAQGLLVNATLTATDGDGTGIEVPGIFFYETKADAENNTNPIDVDEEPGEGEETPDERANFIRVIVDAREVDFALTPVVGALSSGELDAEAVAGLGSSICKVPPLMMCNPQETGTNLDFDVGAYKGFGIRLVEGGNGADWAPGNFGYLQTGLGPGEKVLEYALGANSPPGDCLAADGVTTKPGENASATDAINTRFDIYENGLTNNCTGGTCSPSPNVRKDVVRALGSTNWGFGTGSDPWELPSIRYLPDPADGVQDSPYPLAMGHPRDICHAVSTDGNCDNGRIGDGEWDRNLYFYVNYGPPRGDDKLFDTTNPAVPDGNWRLDEGGIDSLVEFAEDNGITLDQITRYEVYLWELANDVLGPYSYSYTDPNPPKKTITRYNYGEPQSTGGLPASATQLDRRLTAVAVVNCAAEDLHGQAEDVAVAKWVEVFFVEPSITRDRTDAKDIYVEVVRETTSGGNAPTNPQVVRRDVPYLVK